jgi:multiple sugar transport system substrate-binding protein
MVQILQKFKGARCWLSRLTVCCSALLLSLFSLAGCKDDADGKAHIQLSTWGSAQEVAVLKRLLVDFEKQYPDIRVELMHIPDNYYQKLHILVAGDMAPDVMLTNSINFPVYASQNVFMDLEPLLAQSQTIRLGDFYEPSLQAFKWQSGKQTILGALPRDISDVVVFYNRDLFKKAGLPEPRRGWDWQTFLETARALTTDQDGDGRPEVFGVSFYAQPPLFWLPFVWSAGGALFDARLTRVVLDEPRALEGLRFYADLRNRWHVAPRKVESGGATMSQLFLQQKIAMMVSGRWSVPVLREQAKFQWDVAPLPVGPSGRSRVGIDASGYAISAKPNIPRKVSRW